MSAILETGRLPQRYFLSAVACAGILRRAAKQKTALLPMLREVLGGEGVHAAPHHHKRRKRTTRTEAITVHGAREHNLKNVDVRIPRHQFTVLSGVSEKCTSPVCQMAPPA